MKYNTNSENKNEGHNSMGPFSLVFHLIYLKFLFLESHHHSPPLKIFIYFPI